MTKLILAVALLLPCALPAQTQPQADLNQALTGDWTGVLEYRDYSEPPTSTKRVQLPTWLSIKPTGGSLTEHYIYDDGPAKTVESIDTLTLDLASSTYTEATPGKPALVFKVTGYDKLKSGRGDLILLGSGTDNNKPSEVRITLTIRRNLLSWLEEVRPANSTDPFTFRHRYTFTRSAPPTLPATK